MEKAGTPHTLQPLGEDPATAMPTSGIAQQLAWDRTQDGHGEEAAANATTEYIASEAFDQEQAMINTWYAPCETEKPDAPLYPTSWGSEDDMTSPSMMSLSSQQHVTSGYDAASLHYTYEYLVAQQNTLPPVSSLQYPSWTPFDGNTTTQAYDPLAAARHSAAAASAEAGFAGGAEAGFAATNGVHASLGAHQVMSAEHFGSSATAESTSDIMSGVAPMANMGQKQHMAGPMVNTPYRKSFRRREKQRESDRKREARIRNACQTLQSLVPGLSEKTDQATVLESTVEYVRHLHSHLKVKRQTSIAKKFVKKFKLY